MFVPKISDVRCCRAARYLYPRGAEELRSYIQLRLGTLKRVGSPGADTGRIWMYQSGGTRECRQFLKLEPRFQFVGPRYRDYFILDTILSQAITPAYTPTPDAVATLSVHAVEVDFDIATMTWASQPAVGGLLYSVRIGSAIESAIALSHGILCDVMRLGQDNRIYGLRWRITIAPADDSLQNAYAFAETPKIVLYPEN